MAENESITSGDETPFTLELPISKAEKRKAYKLAWQRERRTNPEYREKELTRERERLANDPELKARKRERRADPEVKAKKLIQERERRERYANDPEHRAKLLAQNREHYANHPELKAKRAAQKREREINDPECKARRLARQREYRANHPEYKAEQAARQRKRTYGIDDHTYRAMLENCGHRCPICKTPFNGAIFNLQPVVDHCHKTGIIRGILCFACNASLANLLDNPKLLRAAAHYLEQSIKRERQS